MKKFLTLLAYFLSGVVWVYAQTGSSGTVVDETGEPIIGASVLVKGTSVGTVTDVDGYFSVNMPAGSNTLVISYIGMVTKEVSAANNMKITMQPSSANKLDEVVVTGYGVTKKAAFTGAASVLNSSDIVNKTDPNAIKALDGTVAGLQMSVGSGQPGAPATVFLRGRNSINSGTQPLYVIDGVVMSSDKLGVRESEGSAVSPLANINAQDIESITVLKDATATSIYGARAANGVIVITTKKGWKGKVKVALDTRIGFETMPSYPSAYKLLNQDQYVDLQAEGIVNAPGAFGSMTLSEAKTFLYEGVYEYPDGTRVDTDWLDEVTRNGLIQDYNLSIQGGGQGEYSPTYYISLGMFDNQGIIIGKDLKRYSFRLNLDHQVNKLFKYGVNSTFSYTETNLGTGGGYFADPLTQAFQQSPLVPVYTKNGDWNFETLTGYNPVAQRSDLGDKNTDKQYRVIVSPYLGINFNDKIYFNSRMGVDFSYLNEFGYWSFLQPQGKEMRGFGEYGTDDRTLLSWTNTLNYINTFNENHNLNVLLGQEIQKTNLFAGYLAGSNYAVDYLNAIELTSVPTSAKTVSYSDALASFFMNAQYDYDGKYYLSGSIREDGSSRFGKNNRWAAFYSFGAKYRISAEPFMSETQDWLNNLNIRTSYGTSGNQYVGKQNVSTGWYPDRGMYGFGYNYNGLPGSANVQFENPDLKWEETAKFNVGLDVSLFNRISLEFDYYLHRTKDMVFNVPLSMTTGVESHTGADNEISTSYLKNIGELENKGFEFSVNALVLKTNNFNWDLTFVGSHNKNKVIKLSTDLPIEGDYTIIEEGRDYYTFKMIEYAGVDPETGAPLWYKDQIGADGSVTSVKTKDYREGTKHYMGTASPNFQGSLTNRFNYRDFDLSFQFNFSTGGKIYGSNLRYDDHIGSGGFQNTRQYIYDNRWQNSGDVTDVPKYVYGGQSGYNKHASQYLMDGDYLKIKNITIGYTLPKHIVETLKISSLRVYASSDNLYTFCASDYKGYDPAGIDDTGIQWWNYPLPRNIVFGLNLAF